MKERYEVQFVGTKGKTFTYIGYHSSYKEMSEAIYAICPFGYIVGFIKEPIE